MLRPTLNPRFEQRTRNFNATTSLYNYGTLGAAYNSNTPCTWLALIRPTGAGESNFGYIASKVISASATGMRWIVDHNAGSPRIIWGISSGSTGPSQSAPSGSLTYNKWVWVAATYAGGLAAANVQLYQGAQHLTEVTSYPAPVAGTGSLNTDASNNFVIGNREGSDRTFNGDIAMVVRWDAVLDVEELNRAVRLGPLAVRPSELLFCWAGGEDLGPYKKRASTITAKAQGRPYKYVVDTVFREPWFAQAAAGAFALNAEPATYTFTAFDAGLIVSRTLDAQPATYTLTAFDAGLVPVRVLDAQPAAYAFTGVDAGLLAGRAINAEPAAYALTGFDANLVYTAGGATYTIDAQPAAYMLTGFDAQLFYSNAVVEISLMNSRQIFVNP